MPKAKQTPKLKKRRTKQKAVRDASETIQWNLKNMGRPSLYHEGFCHLVSKMTLIGAIIPDLADLLGTNNDTISEWMKVFPDFSDAIKNARATANNQVEKSLHHRATGYSHKAVKIFHSAIVQNDKGEVVGGGTVLVPYEEHYPPDTAAAFIWLKNRDPSRWTNRTNEGAGGEITPDDAKQLIRERMAEIDSSTEGKGTPNAET